jgi:hypothetical protein
MNISKKLEYVRQAIRSVSTHQDVDSRVRLSALDQMGEIIKAERDAIEKEVSADIAAALAPSAE